MPIQQAEVLPAVEPDISPHADLFAPPTASASQPEPRHPFANLYDGDDVSRIRLGPYADTYDRTIIADVLDNPHNYTTGEALHTILHRVFSNGRFMTNHAVYDYYLAMQHPDPKVATHAALMNFKKWWNWKQV